MKDRCSNWQIVVSGILIFAVWFGALPVYAQTGQDGKGVGVKVVSKLPSKEKRWALIVGIDEYRKDVSTLKGAVNDAKALKNVLVNYAGFPANQVILLTTDSFDQDKRPTRENILGALSDLYSRVPEDGLLLFSFSGHGISVGNQAFLIPSNGRFTKNPELLQDFSIDVSRIKRAIETMKVKQVLMLLDACRNEPGKGDTPNTLTDAYKNGFSFDVANSDVKAFATLYATSIGERAYEFYDKDTKQFRGYFSHAVEEALKGKAANEKGEVTLSRLIDYLETTVPKKVKYDKGETQIPTANYSETYRANQLILAVANKPNIIITVGSKQSNYEEFVERAIEEGNRARDARQYTKAEAAYLRAHSLNPNDSRAVYGLGNLYSDQQRWEEAKRFYRQAITLEPGNPDPFIAISFVLTQPIIGSELSTRYIEAEKTARKAIELDSENPFAHYQLGVALELNGKIGNETQNAYMKAIQIEPEFALAYAHLGGLLRRSGKAEESTAAYTKAITFSKDAPTMILVADVLQSQQRYTDSEQLLRRALREDPKNPTALLLLGRALTTRGAYAEAETILKKSVEISPNSFVSYVLLGSLYSRRGDFQYAEKTLNNALKVISENERKNLAYAFETVGDGYLKNGKKTDAARAYRQAIALDKEKTTLAEKLAKANGN